MEHLQPPLDHRGIGVVGAAGDRPRRESLAHDIIGHREVHHRVGGDTGAVGTLVRLLGLCQRAGRKPSST